MLNSATLNQLKTNPTNYLGLIGEAAIKQELPRNVVNAVIDAYLYELDLPVKNIDHWISLRDAALTLLQYQKISSQRFKLYITKLIGTTAWDSMCCNQSLTLLQIATVVNLMEKQYLKAPKSNINSYFVNCINIINKNKNLDPKTISRMYSIITSDQYLNHSTKIYNSFAHGVANYPNTDLELLTELVFKL